MATYTRQSSFVDGDSITAAIFNDEFNQLVNAFNVSTGHSHDGTTAGDGGPISVLFSNTISIGKNENTDIALTFNATSNDGVLTWMEDEDYFLFSDDILINSTEKLQFRDTAIYLNSSADGQLDIVADTEIQLAATTIDINGAVDISGALTLAGTSLAETISDTVGAMVSSNTETGVTVTYDDSDNTLDFVIGTLNQDTTGNAATATALETARTIHGVSFDGTANIDLSEVIQDTVGAMVSSNTESGITVTYQDGDGTLDFSVASQTDENFTTADHAKLDGIESNATADQTAAEIRTLVDSASDSNVFTDADHTKLDGIEASATADQTAAEVRTLVEAASDSNVFTDADHTKLNAIEAGATADQTDEEIQDVVGAMFTGNTETGITATYQDSDGTIDLVIGTLNQNTTGNAATATALETARTINGVSFDGTGNITTLTAGTGVSVSGTAVSIGQSVATNADANFATVTTTGNTIVGGNLTVNGTTTTLNTATLDVEDKNITLNKGSGDTSGSADGAGFTIQDAVDASNDATLTWSAADDNFVFSHEIVAPSLDISGNVDIDGTLETDALTINGTASVPFESADHTKLDNIEPNATADQTAAEIRTLVESASDSNVFTDADHSKLNAIEASADVTDTANVTSAGALMDSELTSIADVKALDQSVVSGATPTFTTTNFTDATDKRLMTDAQETKLNSVESNATADQTDAEIRAAVEAATDSNVFTDADHSKLNAIEAGATADQTDEEIQDVVGAMLSGNTETGITVTYQDADGTIDFAVASQTDENFTTADHSKLDGIEAGATGDQTNAEIRTAVEAASDSNVFTDADHSKLNAIEASADVTDSTNVGTALTGFSTTTDAVSSDLVPFYDVTAGAWEKSTVAN